MAFFSAELSVKNVYKNTVFGLSVLLDEWYWIFSNCIYQAMIKRLSKSLERGTHTENEQLINYRIQNLRAANEEFRSKQIERRLLYLESRR